MKVSGKQRLLLIGLALLVSAMPLFAQINVTVLFNSATVQDTLKPSHFVQMRGAINGEEGTLPDGNEITWSETSDLIMTNIGGDYWQITFQMNSDDTLTYKFWTGFDATTGTAVVWDGWEGPLSNDLGVDGDNRVIISGDEDMVLPVQYYNTTSSAVNQFYRPYEEVEGSTTFYFRVNMAGYEQQGTFDPEVDIPVAPYGGPPLGPTGDWASLGELTREAETSFWSGAVTISADQLTSGTTQNFKFVYSPDGTGQAWENNVSDRWFDISEALANAEHDTTIHWYYFDNRAPSNQDPIDATVTWLVDPGALQQLGFFDRAVGDRILISGPNGWDIPDQAIEVVYQPVLEQWIAQEDFTRFEGDVLQYKYLVLYDESRLDDTSENYIPGLPESAELWEEPSVTAGGNRTYTYTTESEQQPEGDFGYNFQYYASVPPEGVIDTDMSVTFNIDMEPATDADINDSNPLFRPGVDTAYLSFESPLLMLTQGLDAYDYTVDLEDTDGDGIYSATMDFSAPFTYQIGFRVGYTTDGDDDVVNGGGVEAGRRYYQFIYPQQHTPGGETTWADDFNLRTIDWVPFDLPSETPPDFTQNLSVNDPVASPNRWELEAAYPNPFNPTTTLTYRVGQASRVTVKIYSILGQEVRTVVNTHQTPGIHKAVWDGHDATGSPVASGMYFVKFSGENFSQVRKITLLR